MSTVTAKFTLEHYEHMIEAGAFDGPFKMRVELLNGEIVEMPPIGVAHANALVYLNDWSSRVVDKTGVMVRPQCPLRITANNSEPEPDLAWVNRQKYANHPEPADVLLLIEVADSSLDFDRGEKLSIYAQAGIQDYWIVNLTDSQIEVYRDPLGAAYQSSAIHGRQDAGPNPLAAPTVTLAPGDLF